MHKHVNSLIAIPAILFTLGFSANVYSSVNQSEQDKARENDLAPIQQKYNASTVISADQKIIFPDEDNCKYIQQVNIESDNNWLTNKLLNKLTAQANNRCLGVAGIRLLAQTLQNELIVHGYITSLIDIPSQSLEDGTLTFTLSYGKIGQIGWASDARNDETSLWNALPLAEGDTLKLPDLEQGMANLQRIPGTTARMKIAPGQNDNESDIILTRQAEKSWQVGAWLDDAGSRYSGRYQGKAALYLYDLTTLNDILYMAGGRDVEFNQHDDGSKNASLYYSVPFGYWTLSLYGSYSEYLQQFKGRWSTTDYESKNRYYSATLSRLLSHTREQMTSVDARIFKSTSRYYFGNSELRVMRKQNPGWEVTLHHQRYLENKIVDASLGIQNRLPWLSSTPTPEEKTRLFDKHARVVHANVQSLMKFALTGNKFSYAPQISAQFSPDKLSSDNMFNIGSRWTVRGFDGEQSLSGNQGWYWRNDFIWDISGPDKQTYLGLDVGRITGSERYKRGKVLSGAVAGLRGEVLATHYDLFVGTPLYKPDVFHTDPLNFGFSLQWRY